MTNLDPELLHAIVISLENTDTFASVIDYIYIVRFHFQYMHAW
jgi:hypothetical protein